MAIAEAVLDEARCSPLEITRKDLFQEANILIAQHYERINENKVPGPSINVFKNKHQKPKSSKFIPLKIKKEDTLDVAQVHRAALRRICFPEKLSSRPHFEERSRPLTSFKEPHFFRIQEKQQPLDLITEAPVKLSKIMSDIEGVSKKMEKEKEQRARKARLSESLYAFPSPARVPLRHITSSTGQQKEPDIDWRGIVSTRAFRLPRDTSQSVSESSAMFQEYRTTLKKKEKHIKIELKLEPRKKILSKPDKLDRKVKRIGPHIEIFQVFRERHKLIITKKVIRLVTVMQAFVRGWLERRRLQRLMVKALSHGPSLRAVIDMYRALIHRVRYRLGLWRTRQIINFEELEEWMDRKKFYETMFAKREIWQGIERSELLKYFNECGHYPTEKQVDDYWGLVFRDKKEIFLELIKKSHAIELLFTLYPPHGAHVLNNTRLRSTWLRPIVNGEEGYKYIATGHPILKRANIQIVGKLVAQSIRERKMRQFCKL